MKTEIGIYQFTDSDMFNYAFFVLSGCDGIASLALLRGHCAFSVYKRLKCLSLLKIMFAFESASAIVIQRLIFSLTRY